MQFSSHFQQKSLLIGAFVALAVLTGCAGPKLPETGTPTPYDGVWKGSLIQNDGGNECDGLTTSAEVKFGHMVGKVFKDSTKRADVWGDVQKDGRIAGLIGSLGISGGSVDGIFNGDTMTGSWSAKGCSGTLDVSRVTS